VLPTQSPEGVGHLNAVASFGWDVHVVPVGPVDLPRGLDPAVVVHRLPAQLGGIPYTHGRLRGTIARADRAAFRVSCMAAHQLRTVGGPDLDLPSRWKLVSHELSDRDGVGALSVEALGTVPVPDVLDALGRHDRHHAVMMVPWLAGLIHQLAPDLVHSGPLVATAPIMYAVRARDPGIRSRWLVSDWGTDLSFWARDAIKSRAINAILGVADHLFLECLRDEPLARAAGFRGGIVGGVPFGAGVDVAASRRSMASGPTSSRRVVLLDGRMDATRRPFAAFEAVRRCRDVLDGYELVIHGADESVSLIAKVLGADLGLRTTIREVPRTWRAHADPDHGRARVSISLRVADGIPTWAREASLMGSLPIHAGAGCDDEGRPAERGIAVADADDPGPVAAALRRALTDDGHVDEKLDPDVLTRVDRSRLIPELRTLYEAVLGAGVIA